MLRQLLPLALSFSFCSLYAQDQPEKLKGLLWEISGNGLPRPGYLYGTMHVPEKLAFNLSDSFFIALQQADMLALETDHDQWQAFTEMLDEQDGDFFQRGGLDEERRQSTQADLYHDLFSFSTPDNQLLGAILSAKPRMTNEFLYRSNQYRQDYEEDTYLDLFIFQAGRKLGKTVIGLETMEGSYEAYVRSQLPDDEEEDQDNRYYPGLFERSSIEDAYRDQDLSLLDSLNRAMSPGKNFQRWMQDERNQIMVRGIDSILQSGTTLFSAVGAAHLPGETGLIHMLRDKGYVMRPVQFSARHSKAVKDSIDTLRFPVQFSTQWAPDSSWSVEAPGKFYRTMEVPGLEQQLCTDMSNGAYYAVYHLHTYGLWNGQSPGYIADRIDSLIYEKIPGKIQERKRLTAPFPGHEITTRTRRGDVIRYKILVTPMEVYLFAAGGNGDYALGPEGTQFLNSIRLAESRVAPQPFDLRPPQSGFRLRFPSAPFYNTTTDPKNDRFMAAAIDPADSAFYLFYRADFHDWSYIEEDSFELNIIGENIAAGFTDSTPAVRLLAAQPYPMQDFSFRADRDSAWYHLRLVIDGPHYYLLGCRKNTPEAPASFFNSFAIEPFKYQDKWEDITDTTLMFRSRMPAGAAASTPAFVLKLKSIVEEGLKKHKRDQYMSWLYEDDHARYLKLALQGEEIFVRSRDMFRRQSIPTIDSFQTLFQKTLSANKKMALRECRWESVSPRLLRGDFLLEDTGSTRGIRALVIATPGRVYTAAATVHLDQPGSAFINTFFEQFTPIDTTGGELPFGRRDRQYLQDIYAADSLVREKALKILENAWYYVDKGDFPALTNAIGHPDFGKLRYPYRENLLNALARSRHEGALPYLQDFFLRHPDSARYRQTALLAMARLRTEPALKTALKAVQQEPVYLNDDGRREFFRLLGDSLPLAAKLTRAFIPLLKRQEYRELTLDLLDELSTGKMIRPPVYASAIPELIRETALQINRLRYNAERRSDSDDPDIYRYGSYTSGRDSDLSRNIRLLAPFSTRERRVRDLLYAAARCPDKQIQIASWCLLMKHGRPVPTDTLSAYYRDDRTRIHLYRQLAITRQLTAYKDWFADTIALVRSILVEEARDQIKEQDSIRFRSQHRATRWNRPAVLYFFEIKKKKDDHWSLAWLTLPANARIFGTEPENLAAADSYTRYRDRPEAQVLPSMPESEKEALIRKKIGEIRFANRERYERQ